MTLLSAIALAAAMSTVPKFLRPDDLAGAARSGCNIALVSGEATKTPPYWHTHVWIEFPAGKWIRLYSVRPAEDRGKSLRDCDRWMRTLDKAIKERR